MGLHPWSGIDFEADLLSDRLEWLEGQVASGNVPTAPQVLTMTALRANLVMMVVLSCRHNPHVEKLLTGRECVQLVGFVGQLREDMGGLAGWQAEQDRLAAGRAPGAAGAQPSVAGLMASLGRALNGTAAGVQLGRRIERLGRPQPSGFSPGNFFWCGLSSILSSASNCHLLTSILSSPSDCHLLPAAVVAADGCRWASSHHCAWNLSHIPHPHQPSITLTNKNSE